MQSCLVQMPISIATSVLRQVLVLRISITLLALICLGVSHTSFAQNTVQFESYSQEDGLSNDIVLSIAQDSLGFLWIGTENGLNRFDGKQFLRFRFNPEDSGSISANWINAIYEDSRQNLWIGTANGLNRLNRADGRFERIALGAENQPSVTHNITCLYEDRWQNLWVGTLTNGLWKLTQGEKAAYRIEQFVHDLRNSNSLINNQVESLLEDEQGNLWIGTYAGLNRLNIKTGRIDYFPFPDQNGFSSNPPDLVDMEMDASGNILIVTRRHGLLFINPSDPQPQLQSFGEYFPMLQTLIPFPETEFRCIQVESQHQLWVGTYAGLYQIDLNSGTYTIHTYNPKQTGTLSSSQIQCLFEDREGNLWVGTLEHGLNRQKDLPGSFQYYTHDPLDPTSVSQAPVRTIQEDNEGNVWIGTLGNGLDKLTYDEDQRLVKTQTLYHDPARQNSLLDNSIIKIIKDRKGYLWIATNGYGLNRLDPATGQFDAFLHEPDNPASLSHNRVWNLCEDDLGFIWVGTFKDGLNRLDPLTGQVKRYRHDPNDSNSLSHNWVKYLFKDREGFLWVGTNLGLNRLDTETGQFTHYFHDPADPASLSSSFIWVIYEDRENNLWVGTNAGLNRYDRQSNRFKRFYEKDGIPSNTIYGILEDVKGNIWLSTDNGLARMLPANPKKEVESFSNTFQPLKKEDGLGTNIFLPKSFYKSERTGWLFFGGVEGLVVVRPERIWQNTSAHRFVLSSFSRYNRQAKDSKPIVDHFIGDKQKIVLTHLDQVVTFTLSEINWRKNDWYPYEYKLAGFSEQWMKLGENTDITFTNLQPGKYTLMTRGRNIENVPTQEVHLLEMTVLPPWWKSQWAYTFYILTLASTILLMHRFQLKRQLEIQESRRLKELDDIKSHFFTNISHEFRTPLTIISGMVHQIRQSPDEWLEKGLKMIERNNANLLNLVNQILDLRKLETGNLQLDLIRGDIIFYLRYITESFHSLAEHKHIKIHFLNEEQQLIMDYDKEKILCIISNLISNAIKFTPKGGDVYILLSRYDREQHSMLLLEIQDTGIGLAQEQLSSIFVRFYQVDDSTTRQGEGTGIGLALTQELVKLMEGEIQVESTQGKGTTFKVWLPIRQTAILEDAQANESEAHAVNAMVSVTSTHASDIPVLSKQTPQVVEQEDDRATLLIIEDNADVVQYIASILQQDYELMLATDGQEGIDKAIEHIPDLIISDVMMPKKDGFEVCDTLKQDERTSHIPIILLTAKADVNSRLEGLARGADAYLAKPFHPEELKIRLRKLAELRQMLQRRYQIFDSQPPSKDAGIQQEDAFINKLKQLIEDHLEDGEFGIVELCKAVGMSRSQLYLKIKALTNRSTSHYIRGVRLHKARALLQTSDLNITQVAYEVGFNDPAYFSRVFVEEFGVSPKEFVKG